MFNSIEREKQNLSVKEVQEITGIVDLGPQHLDKINLDNIEEIIEQGEKEIKKERQKINSCLSLSLLEMFQEIQKRSSKSHAIQCSVNSIEDFKMLEKQINNETVLTFLKRHIKMKEILTQLYKIDIMRRIGTAKNEKGVFEKGLLNLERIKKEIQESINDFEKENRESIQKTGLINVLKELKQGLLEKNPEGIFYDKICQNYSELIFSDFELLHEKELEQIIKNI